MSIESGFIKRAMAFGLSEVQARQLFKAAGVGMQFHSYGVKPDEVLDKRKHQVSRLEKGDDMDDAYIEFDKGTGHQYHHEKTDYKTNLNLLNEFGDPKYMDYIHDEVYDDKPHYNYLDHNRNNQMLQILMAARDKMKAHGEKPVTINRPRTSKVLNFLLGPKKTQVNLGPDKWDMENADALINTVQSTAKDPSRKAFSYEME